MLIQRKSAKSSENVPVHSFPAINEPLAQILTRRVSTFVKEQVPLFEAICVALSAHILAFPLFWLAGWALPWPKAPEVLTVIEIDLTHWAEQGPIPKKVTDIIKSEMHAPK